MQLLSDRKRHYANTEVFDGKVGIGTHVIESEYQLQVNGNVFVSEEVYALSDARFKENIEPITDALQKVLSMTGVAYTLKDHPSRRHIGLLAQEVQNVVPEAVLTAEDGTLAVSYPNLVAVLIQATKQMHADIQALKEEVGALKARLE